VTAKAVDLAAAERLERGFFRREVLEVARDCIGAVLVHHGADGVAAGRIVESEAYRGPEDLAAHSAGGRRTKRTEAMFGPAGRAYMFRLYGVCWAFNLVAGEVGEPHAVLIRALEPVDLGGGASLALMAARRRLPATRRELTNGPGKLCQALALDGRHYGQDLCTSPTLYLLGGECGECGRSPRINIAYAGEWAERPWRCYERGNRYVSVAPRD
jgi:DNA-3-methyladenine glycosylase